MKIKKTYLPTIKGLGTKQRQGYNTRKGTPRVHVYKVQIYGNTYFKVQLHRGLQNVSKYFKLKREAKNFVIELSKNKEWKREL